MDIILPGRSGLETIREIMQTEPVPIVIVSSAWHPNEVNKTFLALETGAVAFLEKPCGPDDPGYEQFAADFRRKIKLMAEVRVVRRSTRAENQPGQTFSANDLIGAAPRIVCIGASTGGPPVIASILAGLMRPYPLPILIVQHIAPGFVRGMAEWLSGRTGAPVGLAADGEDVRGGRAYLAPDGLHLGVSLQGRIELVDEPPENGMRPSVSYLFRSISRAYKADAIGVLLSGMGKDGAAELLGMRESGALTMAQDLESSVVHGMPGEAIRLNGAAHVFNPAGITRVLNLIGAQLREKERKEVVWPSR
jgi:two-component system, chemotaxis family, protein-glutamate methylesterase/glutaminase